MRCIKRRLIKYWKWSASRFLMSWTCQYNLIFLMDVIILLFLFLGSNRKFHFLLQRIRNSNQLVDRGMRMMVWMKLVHNNNYSYTTSQKNETTHFFIPDVCDSMGQPEFDENVVIRYYNSFLNEKPIQKCALSFTSTDCRVSSFVLNTDKCNLYVSLLVFNFISIRGRKGEFIHSTFHPS